MSAGADQPGVAARRLQHAQEHGEAAGRAEGADRRARRADRRSEPARQERRAPAAVREGHRRCSPAGRGPMPPTTRARSCSAPTAWSSIRRKPYAVRLEQIYSPSIELERPLTRARRLRAAPAAAAAGADRRRRRRRSSRISARSTASAATCASRRSPFDLDLRDVADGTYLLAIEVMRRDTRRSARRRCSCRVRKGLDDLVARLESRREAGAAEACAPTSSSRSIACATSTAGGSSCARSIPTGISRRPKRSPRRSRRGKNPFAGRTGDFKRHYLLDAANEIMPYRMYVPTTYSRREAVSADRRAARPRRHRGLLLRRLRRRAAAARRTARLHRRRAARLSRRRLATAGASATPPADPATRRAQDFSEQDVMQVLQLVRQQYKIDENRIYLMGHSMGGIGTWKIAPKFPDIWAAIAPIRRHRRARDARAHQAHPARSSCTATPIRRSTSRARARWWRS